MVFSPKIHSMKTIPIILVSILSLTLVSCSHESREKYVTRFFEELKKEDKSTNDLVSSHNILSRTIKDNTIHDGPLGLKMGLTKDDLKHVAKKITLNPRQENGAFEQINVSGLPGEFINNNTLYILNISKKSGLCSVLGINNLKYDDEQSSEKLRDTYLKIQEHMTDKYGEPSEQRGWAMDWMARPEVWIYAGGRGDMLLYKEWSDFENNDNLTRVGLAIDHHRPDNKLIRKNHAQIQIYYEFDNYLTDCVD